FAAGVRLDGFGLAGDAMRARSIRAGDRAPQRLPRRLCRDRFPPMHDRRQTAVPDIESLMGQFHAYLSKKQLKSTRQRDLIAQKFFAAHGHISIEELLNLSRAENPRIGYATVYRTLKLLAECGLA